MAKTGSVLGGERSGHILFSKYETTGDGLVTAIMLMEALVENKCGFSQLLKGCKPFPQIAKNICVLEKTTAMRGISELCEKLQRKLNLRLVVRPSGTEQVIRIMAEGESEENCALAIKIISDNIRDNSG